jgi:hypothetical protein
MAADFKLHISKELQGRIRRCRASVREAILTRLREIAVAAGKIRSKAKEPAHKGPSPRFYVYEGHRILYHLDAAHRRVVVQSGSIARPVMTPPGQSLRLVIVRCCAGPAVLARGPGSRY